MCDNCGCKKPNDAHGAPEAIINKSIREAAQVFGMTFEETVKNFLELAQIDSKEHADGSVHGHNIDHEHEHDHSAQ